MVIKPRAESAQMQRMLIFNQVGTRIQESLSTDDILHSIGDGLNEIGLTCVIMFLDEKKKNLKIAYTSISPTLISAVEKTMGRKTIGFKIRLEDGLISTTAVKEKRAIFDTKRTDVIKKALPAPLTPLAGKLASMIKLDTGITAPLISRGNVIGLLDVLSPDLTAEDVPTIVAFANQAAIAIDNAQLMSESESKTKELEESEEKHRQLLEDMNDGYAVIQRGKYVFANRRYCEMLRYEPGELTGKPLDQLIMSGDRNSVMDLYERVTRGEELPSERYEATALRKDGTTILGEASTKAITYEGKPAFSIILRDITERKRMEEKYRHLLEDMNDAYVVIQEENITFANRRFCELFELEPWQVLGKSISHFIAPDERQESMETYASLMRGEEPSVKRIEATAIKEDGTTFTIEGSGKIIKYEGKPATSVVFEDITERKRMEEELRASEHHHRVLIDIASHLGEGIILAYDVEDRRGVIAFANDAVTKILGYSREELLQSKMRDFVTPESAKDIAQRYMNRQAGDKTEEHYESIAMKKDGTEVPIEIQTGNTIYQGKPALVTFIRDITRRKQMEAQLREYSKGLERMVKDRTRELVIAEESYRAVFEYAGDAIIVTNNDGVVQLWNKEAERMLGYKAEDVVGKQWDIIVPEDLQSEIYWLTDEIRKKDFVKDYVTERVRQDGKRFSVELTSAALKDAHGDPIGFSTILRDITVRQLMEEQRRRLEEEREKAISELARSEERYRSVFEHAGLAMGIYDKNNIVRLANKEAEKMFGFRADELLGFKTPRVVPEDLREESKWLLNETIEKGYIDSYETERLRRDGTRFPVELTFTALKDNKGNINGFTFIGKDITERKKLEQEKVKTQEELALSEERYRSVFQHAGLMLAVFDVNETVLLWNKEAERTSGYSAEEVLGRIMPEMTLDSRHEERDKVIKDVLEKGYVESYETEMIKKDGTIYPVEVSLSSLKNSKGNVTGISFIGKDITERKKLEQDKDEAQQQLMTAERLAAIGELASIVGHELRNPLAVIGNSVYYLKMKLGTSDEKVKKHLDILEGEVAISGRIISNILDFARPKQPILQKIDINPIVERSLEKYTLPDNVEAFTELGKDLSQLTADADQIQQVFINMISNAAQAMPEGGKLLISTTQSDDLIKVAFEDTGVGISPENLEKILQPMFSTKAKGVGLGLTISKRIVENHNGKVEISSQVGQGTTFTIMLPIGGKDEQ